MTMFRFTIRDVLWLTVVVALGLAWLVDRQRAANEQLALQEVLDRILQRHGEKIRPVHQGWWILPHSSTEWEVLTSTQDPLRASDLDFLDMPQPAPAPTSAN